MADTTKLLALTSDGTLARLDAMGFIAVEKRWRPVIEALQRIPVAEITPDMIEVHLVRRSAA